MLTSSKDTKLKFTAENRVPLPVPLLQEKIISILDSILYFFTLQKVGCVLDSLIK